jgi:glycine/D-amino acid oxidase-like deaminating enzyme
MIYLQFIEKKLDGTFKEMLASEGIAYVDNRLCLHNMIQKAIELNAKKLRKADGVRLVRKQNGRFVDTDSSKASILAEHFFNNKALQV